MIIKKAIMNYEANKIYENEFGQVNGVFIVDKPVGKTSHDIVDEFRRRFHTRKVGHAGALDPFATGLLIILVGKAVKQSDSFLGLDKEYVAELALGFKTDTLDIEGKIIETSDNNFSKEDLLNSFKVLQPSYQQDVPIYSSVKVKGEKLRELVRRSDTYTITKSLENDLASTQESINLSNQSGSILRFMKGETIWREIALPSKSVKIYSIELISLQKVKVSDYSFPQEFANQLSDKNITQFESAKIRVLVSKGTYIRKLAEDIGDIIGTAGMLVNLRRTKVGDYSIDNSFVY